MQDGLFVSSAMTPFEQLQHDAIAENAAGGLGVAEMLIRHLTAKGALPPEEL
jgi:Rod binding domain-containing protein